MYHFYQFHRVDFLSHYHKRSNVESTFSMIKAKFRDHVRSKTDVAMVNEVLCKIICHNICCLARRMQTIIIAEPFIDTLTKEPACWLIPSSQNQIVEAWRRFSPMFFTNYLEVLGFKKTTVIRHRQFS
jgi:hypothetical protein